MGSIELKLSCSFCLRAPQPNPCRPPTFRSSPSERYRPLTLFLPHHTGVWQHLGRSRPPPSPSIHPLHGNESRERRGKKAPTVGHREEGGSESGLSGCRVNERESKKRKVERREKDGRERGAPPPPAPDSRASGEKGGKRREPSRAPRATHHILLSRLPTLTAGSVPDRRSRMPTTRAGREESHARHPAC